MADFVPPFEARYEDRRYEGDCKNECSYAPCYDLGCGTDGKGHRLTGRTMTQRCGAKSCQRMPMIFARRHAALIPFFMSAYPVPSALTNRYGVLGRPCSLSKLVMVDMAASVSGTRRGTPLLVWSSRISRRIGQRRIQSSRTVPLSAGPSPRPT